MRSSYVAEISRRHVARQASTPASSHACRKDTAFASSATMLVASFRTNCNALRQSNVPPIEPDTLDAAIGRLRSAGGLITEVLEAARVFNSGVSLDVNSL